MSTLSNDDLDMRRDKNQERIEYLEKYSQRLTKYSAGYKNTLKEIARLKVENNFIAKQIKDNSQR